MHAAQCIVPRFLPFISAPVVRPFVQRTNPVAAAGVLAVLVRQLCVIDLLFQLDAHTKTVVGVCARFPVGVCTGLEPPRCVIGILADYRTVLRLLDQIAASVVLIGIMVAALGLGDELVAVVVAVLNTGFADQVTPAVVLVIGRTVCRVARLRHFMVCIILVIPVLLRLPVYTHTTAVLAANIACVVIIILIHTAGRAIGKDFFQQFGIL